MTISAGLDGPTTTRLDPVQAVASFFRQDPARILTVASALRAPDRHLESTVQGASMGRTAPAGSRIRIALDRRGRYEAGQVVAFLAGGQLVVHRVAHRGRHGAAAGQLLTRGDAVLVPDPPLPHDRVLGVVTEIQRDGEWAAPGRRPRRSPLARLAAILLLAASASLLRVSPRATRTFVESFHQVERALLGATRRLRGQPAGPGPTRGA